MLFTRQRFSLIKQHKNIAQTRFYLHKEISDSIYAHRIPLSYSDLMAYLFKVSFYSNSRT